MTVSNMRSQPYVFQHTPQRTHECPQTTQATLTQQQTGYFTWLVFMQVKWVPFDTQNQTKLEQTLNLGGTFVDIQDSHFPGVKRVRAFPKSYYISYLGVKYRLSRVMQPDAWIDPHDCHRRHSYVNRRVPPPFGDRSNKHCFLLPAPFAYKPLRSSFSDQDNDTSCPPLLPPPTL